MNLFRRIDDFLFDWIFQPIVNRFPDAGPAGAARFLLTGDMVVRVMIHLNHTPHKYGWLAVDMLVITMWYLTADTSRLRMGMRNNRRLSEKILRAFMWVGVLFDVVTVDVGQHGLLDLADATLFLSFFYAVACDKLPPPQKASVWERRRAMA